MSLGRKIIVLFLLLGCAFSIGSYFALKLTVLPAFEEFEYQSAENSMMRADDVLAGEMQSLTVMNIEYSLWDQAYEYAIGLRPEYKDENLDPTYWHSVDVDMMVYYDVNGEVLFGYLGHPETGDNLDIDEEFLDPLVAGHPLVTHIVERSFVKGIVPTRSGLMQVVSYPILRSDGNGPIAGSIIVGSFLESELSRAGDGSTDRISVYRLDSADLPDHLATAVEQLAGDMSTTTFSVDEDHMHAYKLLAGIYGEPAALIEAITPREIAAIGWDAIRAAMILLMTASIVFLLAAFFFTRQLIIKPVRMLTGKILDIRKTGDLVVAVETERKDEVGALEKEFAALTNELKIALADLESARDSAMAMSQTKSEFLARMSHEIRTPMNGVLGMTELLQDTALDSVQRRFTETIYDSASALLNIINDILDFSKIEAGKLQLETTEVDLRRIVEDTVESVAGHAHRKGIELLSVVSQDIDSNVITDPVRLRQVLTNLIGNAIKFTDEGEVRLELTTTSKANGDIGIQVDVSDTGVGIRPEKLEQIFDSFTQEDGSTTRMFGGTGLGLTISKQIVEAMGGEMKVSSEPGVGSCFSFELRLKTGSPIEVIPPNQLRHIADSRVLIVDDNATNREILVHQLTNWRARPIAVSSADEALAILLKHAESQTPFELAILDMHMPNKDGIDLAREIRDNPQLDDLKLVLLSSVTSPATEETLNELNIAGQLNKPIHQSRLYNVLIAILTGDATTTIHRRALTARAQGLQGTVLLAEDNPVNQAVAIGMLESIGINVDVAHNGEEAVQKIQSESFDVVLMDCQMPIMDGFEATKKVRAWEAENGRNPLPIVAITANALKGDREQCLAAGMNDYLSKPFTREQLHATLAPILQSIGAQQNAVEAAPEPVETTTETAPALNRDVLKALEQLQQSGTAGIKDKIVRIFIASSRDLVDRIHVAAERGDFETVRSSAHALKSSSANVGAVAFSDLCRQLEAVVGGGDIGDTPALRKRLDTEYERVIDALHRELEDVAA